MQRSRQMLVHYRKERKEAVRQYVGRHWSEEGSSEKVPVNLLSLYVQVVGRNLIAKNPRVLLSTFDRTLKPMVSAMQTWANKEVEHMHLQETLHRVVVDALFSVGICKVALATPAESAALAWGLAAGSPFAERVDLDDFVYDIHARSFEEVSFIGHRYRVPLDVVKDSKVYNKSRKQLVPSQDNPYNLEGDERISTLGRGVYAGTEEEFEDYVDLWEVYLPRHRVVLTLADDNLTGASTGAGGYQVEALRQQGWVGPDSGPYHILAYGIVPGNAMPKGPIQDLIDLHQDANRAYRKMIRMLDRTKTVTTYQAGQSEDAARIQGSDDGDLVPVNRPDAIKPLTFGPEALQAILAGATTLKDLFVYMAGNLDMLGGLSPQSKTLGQDQMLAQNASRSIADMQETTVSYVSRVVKGLCWYWHNDPFKVQRSSHNLPGLPGLSFERRVRPQQRQRLPFEDLQIEVDPYSMQHQSPQQRMQALDQVMTQIYIPLAQLFQQSGVVADWNAYLSLKAKLMDMPELSEILTIQEPPAPDTQTGGAGASAGQPTKPAQTERTYTRLNQPSQTREASDRNLVSTMLGHNLGGKNGQTNGTT